jgi:hypothetical protein
LGYAFKTVNAFVAPSLNYSFNNITIGGEMIVNHQDNAPVSFGAKVSYQYKFLEIGAGRYFDAYSADPYDSYLNGWSNAVFAAIHYDRFFLQYEYKNENRLSFGMHINL